jgi:hypothetical protein
MKSLYFLLAVFSCTSHVISQTYEIGPVFGNTAFVGDVGSTHVVNTNDFFSLDQMSYGLLFRWNRSQRHSFRFSATQLNTYGFDRNSDIVERQNRNLNFETQINELSLGIEYTFWEWDLHSAKRPQFVPYLHTGIAYYFTNHFARAGNILIESDDLNGLAIPMTFGAKVTIGRRFVFSAEFSPRYTFTDNMDGSNPSELDSSNAFTEFGNPNSNDWYIFAGFSLTYTFGRKPCYNCTF